MTKVSIKWVGFGLHVEVDGHSSAEAGEDNLVCAAVSVLVQSMMQIFRELLGEGLIEKYEEAASEGYARFCVIPSTPNATRRIWDVVKVPKAGFELLAEAYPDKVKVGWGSERKKCANIEERRSGETVTDAQERL